MKKLSQMPKMRLALYSYFSVLGLIILVFIIITEFIHPHNPSESLVLRIVFILVCSIPTSAVVRGVIVTTKEILKMPKKLQNFYAVTQTSIYLVQVINGSPVLKKIALKGQSSFPVGKVLDDGTMLSIGKQLILFIPEGGKKIRSFQKNIAMVDHCYWGSHTPPVKALFLKEKDAFNCFFCKSKHKKWITKTKKVLKKIGSDHPQFTIATDPDFELVL
ncbi:MAG TPA: hypothetical protein VK153_02315 [Candidatus Paceibacterota bacterium]|nr:hypothetical protein [Candidatus Paceibacterota bacterium]